MSARMVGSNTSFNQDELQIQEPTTRKDVYKAFTKLEKSGKMCKGENAPYLSSAPGLYVQGAGLIPLPITREFADKLKQVSPPSANKSVVDINSEHVEIRNPSWADQTEQLGRTAIEVLCGGDCWSVSFSMKFEKLLLCEEGSSFEEHRTITQQDDDDDVFAKIVVQLPSVFTGGNDVVTYKDKMKTIALDNPNAAPYGCHILTYFSDCDYKMLPLNSGYRLMLVYSLCYQAESGLPKLCIRPTPPTPKPTVENMDAEGMLLSKLGHLKNDESLLVFPLKHNYSDSAVKKSGVDSLKGLDQTLSKTIAQACGWKMLIGSLEKVDEEFGYGSDDDFEVNYDDVCQKSIRLTSWLYDECGNDANVHLPWIEKQLDLRYVEDGGMLMAYETLDLNWEEVVRTHVSHVSGSRERTFDTAVLIAFNSSSSNEECERLLQHQSPSKKART